MRTGSAANQGSTLPFTRFTFLFGILLLLFYDGYAAIVTIFFTRTIADNQLSTPGARHSVRFSPFCVFYGISNLLVGMIVLFALPVVHIPCRIRIAPRAILLQTAHHDIFFAANDAMIDASDRTHGTVPFKFCITHALSFFATIRAVPRPRSALKDDAARFAFAVTNIIHFSVL